MSDDKDLLTGPGVGGPADGILLVSRCPKGLLVVDKPASIVHIYDWVGAAGVFNFRESRDLDTDKAHSTADEPDYDIIAIEAEHD